MLAGNNVKYYYYNWGGAPSLHRQSQKMTEDKTPHRTSTISLNVKYCSAPFDNSALSWPILVNESCVQ